MQALKLAKELIPNLIDSTLEEIGSGADGDVYLLKTDPNKVIKYSVYYCWYEDNIKKLIEQRLAGFAAAQQNSELFVNVYSFNYLGSGKRKVFTGEQDYLLFSCTMEKLNKISEDERRVFHSIVSHEDDNKIKKFSIEKVRSMLQGMKYGLDFDEHQVMLFYKNLLNCKVEYTDLHPRNIMKNKKGEFKLIDIDRINVA